MLDGIFGLFTSLDMDLATGAVQRRGQIQLLCSANSGGYVPGGRFYQISSPDFHLIDRETKQVVAQRRMHAVSLSFSADGTRFAALQKDSDTQTITLHATRTGAVLAAVPMTAGVYRGVYLSPEGSRIVAIKDDNTLQTWDLSELAP